MHRPLNRRTLLRATGISLSLPLLESMNSASAAVAESVPQRMVFICNTLGLHPPSLWPDSNEGSSPYLDLLQPHRDDFTLFSGLSHADQLGRQAHDSETTWLTSAAKPGMDGFRNTISVDQVVANHFGYTTRFPSLVLGSNSSQSQSYTSGGVMIPAETSPATVFSKLFLQGKPDEVQAEKRRLSQGRSILDQLKSQTDAVRRRASKSDHHLLNDYLDSIRSTEMSIGEVQGWLDKPKPTVDVDQPHDIADARNLPGRIDLLIDLVPLIIQTDSSRVVSIMIQDHGPLTNIEGVSEAHHILSHHGRDPAKIVQLQKIESEIVRCFGSLLGQLKARAEPDVTLLDSTSVVFGSNLGNANAHDTHNLPVFLAGGGFKHGQYVTHDEDNNTQLSNLFLTLLRNMGIKAESFGPKHRLA